MTPSPPKRLLAGLLVTLGVLAAVLINILLAGDNPPPPVPPDETAAVGELVAEAVQAPDGEAAVIPLSYMVRQAELRTAEVLGGWMACVAGVSGNDLNQWSYANWTRDHHQFDVKYQGFASKPMSVTFGFGGFDPDLSDWSYGPVQEGPPALDERPNHTYLFDNRQGVTWLSGSLSETVVYGQRRTITTSNRWHLDIGSKQDLTIGGEKTGGSFEVEVQEQWGISSDATTANEENTDRTEAESVNYRVKPHHATLATLATPRVRSSQPFAVNGVLDASITMKIRDDLVVATAASRWDEISNAPGVTIDSNDPTDPGGFTFTFTLAGFDELDALANGVNVDYPRVNSALCPEALDGLQEARTIVWAGTIHRDYQTSSEYQFVDVPADDVAQALADHSIPTERIISG